ncbi:MAG: ribosome assembly RNA-binding protein YhbY [Myxococcota bacterium]
MALTSSQRRHLRGLAHELSPVVHVGSAGLSEGVLREVNHSLESHELIKVKLDADRDERLALAIEMAKATASEVAQQIGKIVVLYRPAQDKKKRKIVFPAPGTSGT